MAAKVSKKAVRKGICGKCIKIITPWHCKKGGVGEGWGLTRTLNLEEICQAQAFSALEFIDVINDGRKAKQKSKTAKIKKKIKKNKKELAYLGS